MTIVPDPNFRQNPERAVWVQGIIDQKLVERLLPQIVKLTSQSREPITVFIDSNGGSVAAAEQILRLLKSTNQNGEAPCTVITVAVSKAASAAADLLSSGDYSIAYQDTTLLYHGVRVPMTNPVTAEFATMLTDSLKTSNDRYAMSLARKSEWRFMARVFALRHAFEKYRTDATNKSLTDLQCFHGILRQKLSKTAEQVLEQAIARWDRYNALVSHFEKQVARRGPSQKLADVEKVMLTASTAFEFQRNKGNPEWSLRDGGLSKINDDFLLLGEYFQSAYSDQFRQLCGRYAPVILTAEQEQSLSSLAESEANEKRLEMVRPYFLPFWSFFVALCHALQEGENELTPTDAFWLGLIDEPIGHADLPLIRYFAEFQEEPKLTRSALPEVRLPESLPSPALPEGPASADAAPLAPPPV